MPAAHDGTNAFTLRIAFNQDVATTPDAMRDDALEVSGGEVTAAEQVDGRADPWELTVQPSGTGAVSLSMAAGRACTESGAVCAPDDRPLSAAFSAQVAGPDANGTDSTPLTASFENVPAEHDGETAFTLRVAFSEVLPAGSKRQLRRALSVTGGSTKTILRVDNRLDLWRVKVEPTGTDAVSVSLASAGSCGDEAALCTSDGRALTGTATATVQGPPPLTASFQSVPAEHDGETAFTLRVAFSEVLPAGSKR